MSTMSGDPVEAEVLCLRVLAAGTAAVYHPGLWGLSRTLGRRHAKIAEVGDGPGLDPYAVLALELVVC